MLGVQLPQKLTKATKLQVDPVRALRIIRIQANAIVLLVVALAATWFWFTRVKSAVDLHVLSKDFEPQIRVNIETKVFSGDDNITNTGISQTPLVTMYGKIKDYGALNEALPDFAITIRDARVAIIPENGEFAEKVVLRPGQNTIDLLVWWNGTSRYRQHYTVTYLQATTTSPIPLPAP